MERYKEDLALILAETGALFFDDHLVLKDGRPSPYFVNTAMFKTGRLCLEIGSVFARMMAAHGLLEQTDVILGPSYKGSALALATSIALWREEGRDLPFEYDRKEAKTHGEASGTKGLFVNGSFFDQCRIMILDDVATSMATKVELLSKIEEEARRMRAALRVVAVGVVIDREQTTAVHDEAGRVVLGKKGRNAIEEFVTQTGVPVYAAAGIREVVGFLYREKVPVLMRDRKSAIDMGTKALFDEYLETYGIV
jgi:orotate phosphoribosyltransferase